MKTVNDPIVMTSPEYRKFIEDLKMRVVSARISAARAVCSDMILFYWDIGRGIVEKQQTLGWGKSVVEMVSGDLQRAFPQMTGFSSRNVWYMRRFFEVYGVGDFLQQAVADLKESQKNSAIWLQPADKSQSHRRGRISTPVEIAGESEGQTADGETARRRRAGCSS